MPCISSTTNAPAIHTCLSGTSPPICSDLSIPIPCQQWCWIFASMAGATRECWIRYKDGLRQRPVLRDNVYVLIGPGTFSAAKDEARLLRQGFRRFPALAVLYPPAFSQDELAAPPTGAFLVGEPVGEKLNQYGNVKSVRLPHSGISVAYSTRFVRWVKDGDPLVLGPDLCVPLTLSDAVEGRDVALEAALSRIESRRH